MYCVACSVAGSGNAAASNYQRQNKILEEQQRQISSYGVDEQTGNIVIPIDKAIELMVGENTKSASAIKEGW